MKVAIFGQYYQNDTRPIIKDIFVFFNRNNVELVIEEFVETKFVLVALVNVAFVEIRFVVFVDFLTKSIY